MKFRFVFSLGLILFSLGLFSAIKTFTGTGNFSDAARWGGSLPLAGDNLIINGNCIYDNAANNLAYGTLAIGGAAAGTLSWPALGTNTLNVTDFLTAKFNSNVNMTNGGFLKIRSSWAAKNITLSPGLGTIIWNVTGANSSLPKTVQTYYNLITETGTRVLSFGVGGVGGTVINNNLTISTGTLNAGNNSYTCYNTIYVTSVLEDNSGAGNNTITHLVINSGGRLYSTIGETYTINGNLTMLGGFISGAGIPILNVAGNFLVSAGTNDIGNAQLSVIGTTSVSAILNVSTNVGTKTISDFIVTPTGAFNNATALNWSIGGNVVVNGSLNTNNGTYSLTGTGKTISGTSAITFSNVTCSGTYTNNSNVSLTSSLLGAGTWAQGTSGLLNLAMPTTSLSVTNFNAAAATNTVNYSLAGNQTVRNPNDGSYHHLSLSTSAAKSFTSNIVANGNLAINSATLDVSVSNFSLTVGGNWVNTAGTFTPRAGLVTFNSTTSQTIFKAGGEMFNNITFSNAGNKILLSPITGNTLIINAGSLTANSNSISLIGNWTNNGGLFVGGTGTVFFNGATAQTIFKGTGETFNNITFSNLGNKTLLSSISGNTLTINTSTLTANSNNISLIGNWANNTGLFVPGTGTVLFVGTTPQTIFKSGGEIFYDITFSNAGVKTLLSAITANTLTINSGSFNSASQPISLYGDWVNNGGSFNSGTGNVSFVGSTIQTIFKSGGETFNNISCVGTGTTTLLSAITASNVLINSNLDVNTTNNQITVKGNLTNNGFLNTRTGLIFLNGIIAQTIDGASTTDFYDLTLNNIAGASISRAENLINTLTLSNGTFNTNSQGFTMISTATNTARIAQITGTGDIIGNVTVQRFAPGGKTGWALLGTPISSALTFQNWNDDFAISCPSCPNGTAGGFTSIYSYNEAAVGSYSASTAYVPITSITNAITPNKGYWVYLGTAQYTTAAVTIDVTGTVRKFNNAIPLTKTNTGSVADDGWNLIHNPYPSPIKWSSLRNGNPNVDNALYSYNTDLNGGTGASVAFVNGISSPAVGAGGIGDAIPMCQGFQVHCTANATLTALESYKVAGNPTFLKMNQSGQIASVQPLLRFYLDGPTSFHDETVLYMEPGATNSFDAAYDAIKMAGQDPNTPLIMFVNGTEEFQINGIDNIASSFTMPLKTTTGHTGTYTISLANFNSFPTGACISLYDTFTGTTTDLKTNNYVFTLNASTTSARFVVNITINPLTISSDISQPSCSQPNAGEIIVVGNNSGPWNYIWKDVNGTTVKTSLNKSTADTLLNLTGGDYTIDMNTVGQCDANDSTFTINVVDLVSAQFSSIDTTYLSSGASVLFSNASINSVNDFWDFGDGFGFSSQTNPNYNYSTAGVYTVSLIATSNSGCLDTAYKSIVVISDIVTAILVADNSTSFVVKTLNDNEFLIQGSMGDEENLNFKLYDAIGKFVFDFGTYNSNQMKFPVDLKNYKAGIYYLNVIGTKTQKTIKLPVK